jgi:beta-glucosidase
VSTVKIRVQIPEPVFVILVAALLGGCDAPPAPSSTGSGPVAPTETADAGHLGADAWPELRSPIAYDPAVEARIDELLARMTLEEKVGQVIQGEIRHVTPADVREYHLGSILNGGGAFPNDNKHATPAEWLALADAYYEASMDVSDGGVPIPIMWGSDAVHGHNNVIGATIFPHNIGLGAANHPELIRAIGRATALEVRATGIDWTFAPTVAVAQDDRWGRTYESYSEDPARVADYAREMVIGLQGEVGTERFLDADHVLATAKHYIADGGTANGDDQGDARIGEEELRDIHGPGYFTALEAGVQTVMASFSSWNGVKSHGNRYLLTDVLKERLGFDGLVVSDWNGHGQLPGCSSASCAAAMNAGIDLYMVIEDWKELWHNTLEQARSGEIAMARLDDAVRRILRVKIRLGLFEKGLPSTRGVAGRGDIIGNPSHRAIARQAVRESLVLLKNAGGVLPIRPGQRVLVAGDGAENMSKQTGGWTITWQGTETEKSEFPGGTSILDGLREAIEGAGGEVEHAVDGSWSERPDLAVVVFGEDPYAEYQGDRETLEFEPGEKRALPLLKGLQSDGIPVVSVFLSGRPMWVNPELNASDAFVAAWLPGSEGVGVADVLVADAEGMPRYDFRGRLSFSWPNTPLQGLLNPHHEGYDPAFPLAYGLDYASGEAGPGILNEDVPGLAASEGEIRLFHQGRTRAPWAVFIGVEDGASMLLSGSQAALPGGQVSIRAVDMDVQEDALLVEFSGEQTGFATITGPGLDLSPWFEQGLLSFRLRLDQAPGGALELQVGGGSVDLDARAGAAPGAWQTVTVPLRCFAGEAGELAAAEPAFRLSSAGRVRAAFGNVVFGPEGAGEMSCP